MLNEKRIRVGVDVRKEESTRLAVGELRREDLYHVVEEERSMGLLTKDRQCLVNEIRPLVSHMKRSVVVGMSYPFYSSCGSAMITHHCAFLDYSDVLLKRAPVFLVLEEGLVSNFLPPPDIEVAYAPVLTRLCVRRAQSKSIRI